MVRLLPGSPFDEQKLNATQIELLNEQYGLNDPIPVQFVRYMSDVFQGKLGLSFKWDNKTVESIISQRIAPSAMIGLQSIVIGTVVGLGLGILAALKKNTFWDYTATIISVIGVSVPSFVFAALLQLYLSLKFKWFPISWGMPMGSDFRYIWTVLTFYIIIICCDS